MDRYHSSVENSEVAPVVGKPITIGNMLSAEHKKDFCTPADVADTFRNSSAEHREDREVIPPLDDSKTGGDLLFAEGKAVALSVDEPETDEVVSSAESKGDSVFLVDEVKTVGDTFFTERKKVVPPVAQLEPKEDILSVHEPLAIESKISAEKQKAVPIENVCKTVGDILSAGQKELILQVEKPETTGDTLTVEYNMDTAPLVDKPKTVGDIYSAEHNNGSISSVNIPKTDGDSCTLLIEPFKGLVPAETGGDIFKEHKEGSVRQVDDFKSVCNTSSAKENKGTFPVANKFKGIRDIFRNLTRPYNIFANVFSQVS